jgi:hypothetical protein
MHIQFQYVYEYRGERRFMFVEYLDGAVSVTDRNGDLHGLFYDSEGATLTGAAQLADTHRRAIAGLLATSIAQVELTLAWATP